MTIGGVASGARGRPQRHHLVEPLVTTPGSATHAEWRERQCPSGPTYEAPRRGLSACFRPQPVPLGGVRRQAGAAGSVCRENVRQSRSGAVTRHPTSSAGCPAVPASRWRSPSGLGRSSCGCGWLSAVVPCSELDRPSAESAYASCVRPVRSRAAGADPSCTRRGSRGDSCFSRPNSRSTANALVVQQHEPGRRAGHRWSACRNLPHSGFTGRLLPGRAPPPALGATRLASDPPCTGDGAPEEIQPARRLGTVPVPTPGLRRELSPARVEAISSPRSTPARARTPRASGRRLGPDDGARTPLTTADVVAVGWARPLKDAAARCTAGPAGDLSNAAQPVPGTHLTRLTRRFAPPASSFAAG